MRSKLTKQQTIWVFLGAFLVATGLLFIWGVILLVFYNPQRAQILPTAELSFIKGPTMTSTLVLVTETPEATSAPEIVTIDGISKGTYVQIFDTASAGLRLRIGPGIDETTQFLAPDGEVYRVEDGPQDKDGYIWWYLVAPYDQTRSGWAVAKYLKAVSASPQ